MAGGEERGWGWIALTMATLVGASCTETLQRPTPPPFLGEETAWWQVQESEPTGRDDILPAFEQSAKRYGCTTEHIGSKSSSSIMGEERRYFGVSAACYEGTIAVVTLVGGRVRIGCQKPTTAAACSALLRNIAEGG